MSVPTDAVSELVFAGAGSAAPLGITFKFIDPADLVVTSIVDNQENPTPLVRGVHFTVTGGNGSTGSVIPAAAIPIGTSWRVRRDTPVGQPAVLESGKYQPEQIEGALDRQALINQEQDRELDRAVKGPRGQAAPALDPSGLTDGDLLEYRGGALRKFRAALFAGMFYAGAAGTGLPVPASGFGADAALRPDLAAATGAQLVGYKAPGTGTVTRSLSDKLDELPSFEDYGAIGDGVQRPVSQWIIPGALGRFANLSALQDEYPDVTSTSQSIDWAALQQAFNDNPTSTVYGTPGRTYMVSHPVMLTDADGHNFQGNIDLRGAVVKFTTAGNPFAADSAMENGFVAYPTLNADGGDISGMRQSAITNGEIHGPENGAGIRLTNSQNIQLDNLRTFNNRYGLCEESCIGVQHTNCTFEDSRNAGCGLIRSLNPNVWYRDPNVAWWNDNPSWDNCGFKCGLLTQPAAHILDHGSSSLPQRFVYSCYFYSRWDGYIGANISTQFGIVSRNGSWTVEGTWFENVARPIRILEENSLEPTNLEGVAGAQPNGTYAVANFPNGFSYAYASRNCTFTRAFIEQEISGVRGVARTNGHLSLFIRNGGTCIKSITTSNQQVVIDDPARIVGPVGTFAYQSFVNGIYINDVAQYQPWTPTLTPGSGALGTVGAMDCAFIQRGKAVTVRCKIPIPSIGTASGPLSISVPVLAKTDAGGVGGSDRAGSGRLIGGHVSGSAIVLRNDDNALPAVNGSVLVFSGTYEAA